VFTGFRWGNLRERDHMEDPSIDERVILKGTIKKLDGCLGWIDLAQDIASWRAHLNAVMNLWVP